MKRPTNQRMGGVVGPPGNTQYWAFVSYTRADERQARWLHTRLETYRLPKDLVGTIATKGIKVPDRLSPCFLDRDELPACTQLDQGLVDRLNNSYSLVVVCSKVTPESTYVNKEVETAILSGKNPYAWIVNGDPPACFPASMRATEPAGADIRPGRDSRSDAVLKLIAGILGLDLDTLRKRDRIRRRRQLAMVAAATFCLVTLIAYLASNWVFEQRQARSRELAARADQASDSVQSLRYALDSVAESPTLQAERALSQAMDRQRTEHIFLHEDSVYDLSYSPDGSTLLTAK